MAHCSSQVAPQWLGESGTGKQRTGERRQKRGAGRFTGTNHPRNGPFCIILLAGLDTFFSSFSVISILLCTPSMPLHSLYPWHIAGWRLPILPSYCAVLCCDTSAACGCGCHGIGASAIHRSRCWIALPCLRMVSRQQRQGWRRQQHQLGLMEMSLCHTHVGRV